LSEGSGKKTEEDKNEAEFDRHKLIILHQDSIELILKNKNKHE